MVGQPPAITVELNEEEQKIIRECVLGTNFENNLVEIDVGCSFLIIKHLSFFGQIEADDDNC